MKAFAPSFVMIQKHPDYKKLPYDHPAYNNLTPIYIDKYDRKIRIDSSGPLLITTILMKQKLESEIESQQKQLNNDDIQSIDNLENNLTQIHTQSNLLPALIIDTLASPEKSSLNHAKMNPPLNSKQDERKTFFNGLELLDLDTTSNPSLVENLIPKKEITVLAGKGDTGKSLFYLNLSLSIVLKQSNFLEFKIFPTYNSVLIISTEDGESVLKDRIKKQIKGITNQSVEEIKKEGLIGNLLVRVVQDNLLDFINDTLQKKKVDLLILDALGDIIEGDENSQKDVRVYYDKLYTVISKHDCAILIIAHENKGSQKRSNRNSIIGSTAIVDRARSVLMLSRDQKSLGSKLRLLTIVKANYIPDELKGKPIKLNLNSETITYSIAKDYDVTLELNSESSFVAEKYKQKKFKSEEPNDAILKTRRKKPGRKLDEDQVKEAIKLYQDGYTLDEIGRMIGKHKTTIFRWIKDYGDK